MGCMMTRDGIHRHAYRAGQSPEWVTVHAVSASVQSPHAGQTMLPLTSGVATFAADGAPFYNDGYLPGYPATQLPGGRMRFQLPPVAAQLDLSDRQSWDRPVFWPGSF